MDLKSLFKCFYKYLKNYLTFNLSALIIIKSFLIVFILPASGVAEKFPNSYTALRSPFNYLPPERRIVDPHGEQISKFPRFTRSFNKRNANDDHHQQQQQYNQIINDDDDDDLANRIIKVTTLEQFNNLTKLERIKLSKQLLEEEEREKKYLLPVMLIDLLIYIIGLCGNAIVILVILRLKRVDSVTDIYILNLAVADLTFIAGLLPLIITMQLENWIFGQLMCKVGVELKEAENFRLD